MSTQHANPDPFWETVQSLQDSRPDLGDILQQLADARRAQQSVLDRAHDEELQRADELARKIQHKSRKDWESNFRKKEEVIQEYESVIHELRGEVRGLHKERDEVQTKADRLESRIEDAEKAHTNVSQELTAQLEEAEALRSRMRKDEEDRKTLQDQYERIANQQTKQQKARSVSSGLGSLPTTPRSPKSHLEDSPGYQGSLGHLNDIVEELTEQRDRLDVELRAQYEEADRSEVERQSLRNIAKKNERKAKRSWNRFLKTRQSAGDFLRNHGLDPQTILDFLPTADFDDEADQSDDEDSNTHSPAKQRKGNGRRVRKTLRNRKKHAARLKEDLHSESGLSSSTQSEHFSDDDDALHDSAPKSLNLKHELGSEHNSDAQSQSSDAHSVQDTGRKHRQDDHDHDEEDEQDVTEKLLDHNVVGASEASISRSKPTMTDSSSQTQAASHISTEGTINTKDAASISKKDLFTDPSPPAPPPQKSKTTLIQYMPTVLLLAITLLILTWSLHHQSLAAAERDLWVQANEPARRSVVYLLRHSQGVGNIPATAAVPGHDQSGSYSVDPPPPSPPLFEVPVWFSRLVEETLPMCTDWVRAHWPGAS